MSKTLTEIAQHLKDTNKKVQLIYAFNGTGKTRLSRAFKELITPKNNGDEGSDEVDQPELSRNKILYYNAFTEDLFYWDNDLESDDEPKLKIQPNSFTDWILKEQGQDQNIIANFQRYANDKLTPRFNEEYKTKDKDEKEVTVKAFSEVTFSLERGNNEHLGNLKISKGEESNFIWSIFYTLLDQVISIQRYHFTLLRNLYEKSANFLGYPQWSDLLPENKQSYSRLVMNFYSHRTLSNEEVAEPTAPEKQTVKLLLENLKNEYGFWQEEEQNG